MAREAQNVDSRLVLGPRLVIVALIAAIALACAPAAGAYTFGPGVSAIGPEVTVFDKTTQSCGGASSDDIPDQPARAFRNAGNQVVLIDSHHTVRRYTAPSLAQISGSPTSHLCAAVMGSGTNTNPAMYDDREWLATMYASEPGTTVHGVIHAEYQGWEYGPNPAPPHYCVRPGELFSDKEKCWYNVLTSTVSTNGGATFSHAAPPGHYLAGPPYPYIPGTGPIGFFQPSNIVKGKDNAFYMLVHVEDYGAQPNGSCLFRTTNLADKTLWRAWDGTGFNVRFRDPYTTTYPPAEGVCAPVSKNHIGTLSESLTWSTFLNKWVLVGSADNADGVSGPGFYYYTSDDLINWSVAKLLMNAELPWTYSCSDGNEQLRDPSLLDPASTTRNFETIGQRPYLFFTRFNITVNGNSCPTTLDRDLIRIPIEFSAPPSGGGGGGGGTTGGGVAPGGGSTAAKPAVTVQVKAKAFGKFRLVGKPSARKNGSLLVKVDLPSAGKLTVRGTGKRPAIIRATKFAGKAGTVAIGLRPSKAGRRALRKKRRTRVKVAFVFTPVGRAAQKSSRVLIFKRARTR
jgi:hypothetical protein